MIQRTVVAHRSINSTARLRSLWLVLLGIGLVAGPARLASGDPPPFFPIGIYCVDRSSTALDISVTREFEDIAGAGFNLIHSYQFNGSTAAVWDQPGDFLDAAHSHGLKVLMGIPKKYVCDWSTRTQTCDQNLPDIQERVVALSTHPALFGWEIWDEPDNPAAIATHPEIPGSTETIRLPPETLAAAYSAIKASDPVHPVAIFTVSTSAVDYVNGFDWSMPGWLFIPVPYLMEQYREIIDQEIAILTSPLHNKTLMQQLTIYDVLNDYQNCPDGVDSEFPGCQEGYPTTLDMRFMAYYAIIHGTQGRQGLMFHCYRFNYGQGPDGEERGGDDISRRTNPAQWERVSSVSRELRAMSRILEAYTLTQASAGVTIRGATPVQMVIKEPQERPGRTYLLTVNPSPLPVQLPVLLARNRFPNPQITLLLPEEQRIPFGGGFFTAAYSSYTVRIYEIIRDIGTPPPLQIITATLPAGQVGVPYVATLVAQGGTPPYTWRVTQGALPGGLTLSPPTGVITGTPTTAGPALFTMEARDAAGPPQQATRELQITIGTPPPLQPPSNVQAEGRSPTTIHLSWTNPFNPRAERIQVQRSDRRETGYVTITTVPLPSDYAEGLVSTSDDASRSPNSRWFYQLLAERGDQRASTGPVVALTHAAPPARLPEGSFPRVEERHLTVAWGNGGNPPATRYGIDLATNTRFTPLVEQDTVRATRRVFSSLTPNTEYFSQVKALNDDGRETPYTPLGSTVTLATRPTDPGIPEVSTTELLAQWDRNGNPPDTEYIAELALNQEPFMPIVSSATTIATFHRFSGLTPDTTYHFRVKARNRLGRDSRYSDLVSTRTARALQPPQPPRDFTAEGTSATTIHLSWSNPLTAREIYVERSATGEGNTFVRIATVTLPSNGYPPSSVYDDSTLSPNSQWWYQLTARNEAGESPASVIRNAVTSANVPLPLPYTEVVERALTAHWDANGNPPDTKFTIELATQDSFNAFVASATVTTTRHPFAGLTPGTTYRGRVKASNRATPPRETDYAPLGSTTTLGVRPPAAVTNFQALVLTRQRVRLTWAYDGEPVSGFRLSRSMDPPRIPYEPIAELRDGAQRAYVDTRLPPGRLRTIRYHILAFGPGGESPRTETGIAGDTTPLGLALSGLPELTNQPSVPVSIQVTGPITIQEEREVLLTVDRRTPQGQDQLWREVLPVGETQRRSVSLREGSNELLFTLRDLVTEDPMQAPTRRPVVVDRDPPRLLPFPAPRGTRVHGRLLHGMPRSVSHPVFQFSKPVLVPPEAVLLTRLSDQLGNRLASPSPIPVTPVLEGRHLFLRDARQQPLGLASHSQYRLQLVKERITDLLGNPLAGPVDPLEFRTSLNPAEPHGVVRGQALSDQPIPARLAVAAGALRTESYLLLNRAEEFLDPHVSDRIRRAHEHLSRVAHQFRMALAGVDTEVALFNAHDGAPLTDRLTGLTLT
ncbi:MAG: fibronectin type III domain-containing protein, partial [Elusimicrobia bacterium]|nr:fibronectin type III domain-containing protein [Elusimicrobiota bacterium]